MNKNFSGLAVIAVASAIAACGIDSAPASETPAKQEELNKPVAPVEATPTSMQGASCATLPTDVVIELAGELRPEAVG